MKRKNSSSTSVVLHAYMLKMWLFLTMTVIVFTWQTSAEGSTGTSIISMHLTTENMDGQEDGFYRFYLSTSNVTLQCRVQSDSAVTVPPDPPTVTFENSSWSKVYTFPPLQDNNTLTWSLTLTRQHLILEDDVGEWLPLEQWKVTVASTIGSTQLEAKGTLIDVASNPHLYWDIGEKVTSAPVGLPVSTAMTRARRSPCSPDVAVVALKTAASQGFYVARTSGAFGSGRVEWFKMHPEDICSSGCDSVFLSDVLLTNHHVILMTSAGVLVSNDLRGVDISQSPVITFSYTLTFDMPLSGVLELQMSYTGSCLARQYDLEGFPGDTITVTIPHEQGTSHGWYSVEPFDTWTTLETHLPGAKLMDSCHGSHTNSLITLVQTQAGGRAVEVTMLTRNATLKSRQRFPEFHFPPSASVDRLAVLPTSQLVYAFGQQVWLSEDGGNSFQLLHSLHNDTVTGVIASFKDEVVVMETTTGSILYGKPGVARLVPLSSTIDPLTSAIYIDFFAQVVRVQFEVAMGTVNMVVLSTLQEVQDHNSSSVNPMAFQILSHEEVLLFEHAPLNTSTTPSSGVSGRNVGQIFSAVGGGEGVVTEVRHDHVLPGYLAVVTLRVTTSFRHEGSDVTPAQAHSLSVSYTNVENGEAILILESCCSGGAEGWQEDDVSKTVVIPGTTSFLLTSYVNETHIEGAAVVLTDGNISRAENSWFVVDLGVHSNVTQWVLKEAPCPYQVTPTGVLRSRSQFELDLDDVLTAVVSVHTTGHQHTVLQPVVYAALSNPWPFQITSNQKVLLATSEVIQNVTMKIRSYFKGVTVVRFHVPHSSLLCPRALHAILVYAGCPCQKRLLFVYPVHISDQEFLHGDPLDKENNSMLQSLEVNYRPPSRLGVGIPTNRYVYNADPSRPRPHDRFRISQETGKLGRCGGATSQADCNCTDRMRLSAHAEFSDCRQRVFRLLHPGVLLGHFAIESLDQPLVPLQNNRFAVVIEEVNGRAPAIRQKGASRDMAPFLRQLRSDVRFVTSSSRYMEPGSTEMIMNGSGLYHYHAEVIPGLSFCRLSVHFQVYVVQTPIAYPLQYILNFGTGVVIGGIFFFMFLWYMAMYHVHRPRRTGLLCLAECDLHALGTTDVQIAPPL